jgi:PBP1b-binding outer membrane lipoprotein LpoB
VKKILLLAILLAGCSWEVSEQEMLDAQKSCAANGGLRSMKGNSVGTDVVCNNGGKFLVMHKS